jgi:hypothetical protein
MILYRKKYTVPIFRGFLASYWSAGFGIFLQVLLQVSVSLSLTYLVPGRKQGFRDGGEGALPELEGDGSPTVHHEVELPVLPAAHVIMVS